MLTNNKKNKYFYATLAVCSLLFLPFAALSAIQGAKMNQARSLAQAAFDQLQASAVYCDESNVEADPQRCEQRAEWKLEFERHVAEVDHRRSLMFVFVIFAVFLPGVTWALFLLTQSVFQRDPANRQFDP